MSAFRLYCALCRRELPTLGHAAAHAIDDHSLRLNDLASAKRQPDRDDAAEYAFALPDGRVWLQAVRLA